MTLLHIVFHSILSAAVWRVSIEDDILVSGYEGSGAEIRCPYDHGYESYGKYLCTKNCDYPDIVIETNWDVSRAERGRFSLKHDTMRREFIVFVSNLTFTDAGTYWCGVSKNGKDIYTKVMLRIVKDWCCDSPTFMQAKSQDPVSISCPYEPQYNEREKYFCRGAQPSACIQQAIVTSKHDKPGRISLQDNIAARVFTVTITGLTKEDSGTYMCGIHIDQGLDVYTLVNLEVNETTTTLSPTTTTFSTFSPSLPTMSLSSPGSTISNITLQTQSHENSIGTSVIWLIGLAAISVSVLVLVICICRCKRKRMLGSAGPNRETGLQEGNFQNTEAAVGVKLASCGQHSFDPDIKASAELQRETGLFEDIYINTEVNVEVKRKHPMCKPQHPFYPEDESVYENTKDYNNHYKYGIISKKKH